MIAAALICGPQLLIADEPTTALDVTVQAQILELLRDLSETSRTALMLITHDLGVVAETCTRMITMYAGEVIEDAAVDDALVRPLHPYTSGLLRSLPHLSARRGKLASIPGRVPSIMDMPNGCRFKARCPYAVDACDAEQELRDAGGGRKVRCWRFAELDLPGALAPRGIGADRRHGGAVTSAASRTDRLGARPRSALPDHRSPRHREGGRRRQFRRSPRRDLWHHRRVRLRQDHDRPRLGVPAEAERGRDPAQRASIRRRCRASSFRATDATTRSSFRTPTPR